VALLAVLGLLFTSASTGSAHPLGNFTINHYSRLLVSDERVELHYVLDFAEIPTVQRKGSIDVDGDGTLSPAEVEALFRDELMVLLPGIVLEIEGEPVVWSVTARHAELQPGQAGLDTLRLELDLAAELPVPLSSGELAMTYEDKNYGERLGWREIVTQAHDGARLASSTAPATSISNELRAYPDDLLATPPDVRAATLVAALGSASPLPAVAAGNEVEAPRTAESRFARFVELEDLSLRVIALSLLAAFAWGAAHALMPGHGKAVVAAYLVGTRGTARHAAFLAATVTMTHTAGVFMLALVTLWLSNFIVPERLYPWLTVVSGLLVLGIGLTLLVSRLRAWRAAPKSPNRIDPADHARMHASGATHSHDGFAHAHVIPGADGSRVTPHSLLALGVSGGLVPCPSALVLLLGATAAGRVAYGMLMVLAFSMGLAVVLLLIGVLVVYARWIVRRFSFEPRVPKLLPALSAVAISVAGLLLVADSLALTGVI